MAVNDPLRRHQIAQRLERLRAERDLDGDHHPPRPPAPRDRSDDVADGSPTSVELADMIQAAAEQLLAERSGRTGPPPPPRVAAPATWEREWWRDGAATDRARAVFLGDDAWVLAWVLHTATRLPLVVVEERLAGARNRVWLYRHALVETPDGGYLDVTGVEDRASLLARHAPTPGARSRVARLPRDLGFAQLRERVRGRAVTGPNGHGRWQDALSEASPEVVELLARELAAQHGPLRSVVSQPSPRLPGQPSSWGSG